MGDVRQLPQGQKEVRPPQCSPHGAGSTKDSAQHGLLEDSAALGVCRPASLVRLAEVSSLLSIVVNTVKSQLVVTLFEGSQTGIARKSLCNARVGTEQTADLKTKIL